MTTYSILKTLFIFVADKTMEQLREDFIRLTQKICFMFITF